MQTSISKPIGTILLPVTCYNYLAYRLVHEPFNSIEHKKEYNCVIETAEKNVFEKTLVDKKFKAQKRLKNIKNNTTLEKLTR